MLINRELIDLYSRPITVLTQLRKAFLAWFAIAKQSVMSWLLGCWFF